MDGMDRLCQSLEELAAEETAADLLSYASADSDFAHHLHGTDRANALKGLADDLRAIDRMLPRTKQPKRRKWYW